MINWTARWIVNIRSNNETEMIFLYMCVCIFWLDRRRKKNAMETVFHIKIRKMIKYSKQKYSEKFFISNIRWTTLSNIVFLYLLKFFFFAQFFRLFLVQDMIFAHTNYDINMPLKLILIIEIGQFFAKYIYHPITTIFKYWHKWWQASLK